MSSGFLSGASVSGDRTTVRPSLTTVVYDGRRYGGVHWHVQRYREGTCRGGCGCGRAEANVEAQAALGLVAAQKWKP
ncbi:hypothetical protein V6Z12_A12G194400 [Gossypium hirsutum]